MSLILKHALGLLVLAIGLAEFGCSNSSSNGEPSTSGGATSTSSTQGKGGSSATASSAGRSAGSSGGVSSTSSLPGEAGGAGQGGASTGGGLGTGGQASSGGVSNTGGTASGSGGASSGAMKTSGATGSDTGGSASGGSASLGGGRPDAGGGSVQTGSASSGGAGTAGTTGGTTVRSAGCGKTPTLKSGQNTLNGRPYIIRIPSNYDSNKAYRLIFGFHWLGGSMQDVDTGQTVTRTVWSYYGLQQLDTEKTAIFVAPQGNGNGWGNPGGADLTFVDNMVKLIEDDLCVDTTKLFALGFSYGGGMSYAIACARAKVFRAVAIYDGGVLSGCTGGNDPIAYLQSHGVSDGVLGISGARGMRDRFVKNNGCTSQSPPEPKAGSQTHITTEYTGCKSGYPLTWIAFDGGHDASPCDGSCINAPADTKGRQTYLPALTWKFFTQFQ